MCVIILQCKEIEIRCKFHAKSMGYIQYVLLSDKLLFIQQQHKKNSLFNINFLFCGHLSLGYIDITFSIYNYSF